MQEHISEGQTTPVEGVAGAEPAVGGRPQAPRVQRPPEAPTAPEVAPARRAPTRRRGEPLRAVAERLNIHPETLRTWCSEGRLGETCFKDPETRAWMITSEGVRGIQAGRLPTPSARAAAPRAEAEPAPAGAVRTRAKFILIDQFVQEVDWKRAVARWCSAGVLEGVCLKSPEGQWQLKQSAVRQMSSGSLMVGAAGGAPVPERPEVAAPTRARRVAAPPMAAAQPRGRPSRMVAGAPGRRETTRQIAGGRGGR